MENVLVASCKRVKGKVLQKVGKQNPALVDRTIQLSDGAELVVGGLGLLDKKAKMQADNFVRLRNARYKTNMQQENSLAVKTRSRDYCLQMMLESGEFTFDHMYVIRNPYGESPLVALALFVTETACRVRVTTKGKTPETDYVSILPSAKKHRVPILGLYPSMENQVLIELLDDYNQTLASHMIPIETKNLPGYMVDCITVKKKAENPAFPLVLINGGVDIHTCAFDREEISVSFCGANRGDMVFSHCQKDIFSIWKEISLPHPFRTRRRYSPMTWTIWDGFLRPITQKTAYTIRRKRKSVAIFWQEVIRCLNIPKIW